MHKTNQLFACFADAQESAPQERLSRWVARAISCVNACTYVQQCVCNSTKDMGAQWSLFEEVSANICWSKLGLLMSFYSLDVALQDATCSQQESDATVIGDAAAPGARSSQSSRGA